MKVLTAEIEAFTLRRLFTISRGSKAETIVVTATISDGEISGRGECGPNARYDETPESVLAQIMSLAPEIAAGLDRQGLQMALPPGAARNAIDCAFWDFEAKRSGVRAWQCAGLSALEAVETAFTLSADSPEAMAEAAAENAARPLLKLKLTGTDDIARVRAVHDMAPQAHLIVDANESWDAATYLSHHAVLADLGVVLIEQPMPQGADAELADLERSVPICADESFHDATSIPELVGRYDFVNIKLDKTGGLTAALATAAAARAAGFGVMVGCMVGTSLAMAPAFLVAQDAGFVDLDGPLLLARDREPGIAADGSLLQPPPASLWG